MSSEDALECLTLLLANCLAFSFVLLEQGLNWYVAQAGPELMSILLPQPMSQSLHVRLELKALPWGHLWLEWSWAFLCSNTRQPGHKEVTRVCGRSEASLSLLQSMFCKISYLNIILMCLCVDPVSAMSTEAREGVGSPELKSVGSGCDTDSAIRAQVQPKSSDCL